VVKAQAVHIHWGKAISGNVQIAQWQCSNCLLI